MENMNERKQTFKENLAKVATQLGKDICAVSRDKYLEIVRKINLPRLDLHSLGGYRNLVSEVADGATEGTEDYFYLFKSSLAEVSKILDKHVLHISRDEYIKALKSNKLEGLTKHRLHELGGYIALKNSAFEKEIEHENKKSDIIKYFRNYVVKNMSIPSFSDFKKKCDTKNIFDNIEDLEREAVKVYPEIKDHVFNETSFTPEYRKALEKNMKSHKRYIITTAVSGKRVNEKFVGSIKAYAKKNNAMVLVLPCEDVANRKAAFKWQLDPRLKDFSVVYKDTYLNSNIYVSSIKVSAKQLNPQTGLPQFTQDGTVVLASPKQDLEYVANSNNKLPNAIMTTGAITEPDYTNDAYMQHRISKISEHEHVMGAIVVDVVDDKLFHFRQVQMGPEGEFIDLCVEYLPDGSSRPYTGNDKTLVLGDSHFGEHDSEIFKVEKEIIKEFKVNNLVLHDIFSAQTITHHDNNKSITKAIKARENLVSLEDEANRTAELLDEISVLIPKEVVIVDSNHHEHLNRYLEEGRYATDPINTYYSLDIVKAFIEGEMPFKFMMMNKTKLKNKKNLVWLEADVDKDFYGIEISQHGHRGSNGARGNLTTYRKAYKKSVSGHTHTPRIFKGAWSVGTSSKLRLSYTKGLSSWVHTICIMYVNGTRQLINIIKNGETNKYSWKLK